LQAKNFDNSSLKEKLTRITDQYMSLKTDNEFLKKENHSLKEENDFNYTLMEDMKKKFTSHELLEIEWKHKK
jgi:FtsZ-binding cell division protein ZapB